MHRFTGGAVHRQIALCGKLKDERVTNSEIKIARKRNLTVTI